MTAFVVIACLVALALGFVAGVIVAEVARRRSDADCCPRRNLHGCDFKTEADEKEVHKAAVRRLWR